MLWGVPYAGTPSLAARIMLTNQVYLMVLGFALLYAIIWALLGQMRESLLALPFALGFIGGMLCNRLGWYNAARVGLVVSCGVCLAVFASLFGLDTNWVVAIGIMSILLLWRHKDNIKRLIAGQESRIGSKKAN